MEQIQQSNACVTPPSCVILKHVLLSVQDESKAHTSSAGATDPADRQALSAGQQPADSRAPKGNSKDGAEASKEQEADKMFVTEKQMKESGYGDAFAKILESIPDHIKNSGPQEAQLVDSPTQGPASDSASSSESADGTDSSSNEDRAREALAAAAGHLEEQQQHQALSLDAGQAYPEHTAQVCMATTSRHIVGTCLCSGTDLPQQCLHASA